MSLTCDYCNTPDVNCCSEWDGHGLHYEHAHACHNCGKTNWRKLDSEGSGHDILESELESIVSLVKGGKHDF